MFYELIFVIWYDQFSYVLSDAALPEALRMMSIVRPFELVFLLQLPHPPSTKERRGFESVLETFIAKGLLDFLGSSPTIRVVQPYPLVQPYP